MRVKSFTIVSFVYYPKTIHNLLNYKTAGWEDGVTTCAFPYKIRTCGDAILISYLRNRAYFVGSYKGWLLNKSLYYNILKN